MPRAHQLDRVIVQSGLEWTVGLLLAIGMLFFLGALTASMFHLPMELALLAGACWAACPGSTCSANAVSV